MNGTTLSDFGWNLTDYTTKDEPDEPTRPDTEMLTCADGTVTVFEENKKWVKSDYTIRVKP